MFNRIVLAIGLFFLYAAAAFASPFSNLADQPRDTGWCRAYVTDHRVEFNGGLLPPQNRNTYLECARRVEEENHK